MARKGERYEKIRHPRYLLRYDIRTDWLLEPGGDQ